MIKPDHFGFKFTQTKTGFVFWGEGNNSGGFAVGFHDNREVWRECRVCSVYVDVCRCSVDVDVDVDVDVYV